jgi:hypothetical protein
VFEEEVPLKKETYQERELKNSIKKYIVSTAESSNKKEIEYQQLDRIMERENNHNKTEIWSKLDKTQKIQRLHAYAEKYGADNGQTPQDVRNLKSFFIESLDKGRLQKVKDVIYDKEKREITSIPGLCLEGSGEHRHFTLRHLDVKRISTLKSLTLKRTSKLP